MKLESGRFKALGVLCRFLLVPLVFAAEAPSGVVVRYVKEAEGELGGQVGCNRRYDSKIFMKNAV